MITVAHLIKNLEIGGMEVLVKDIINNSDQTKIRELLIYFKAGPLLDQISEKGRESIFHISDITLFKRIKQFRKLIKKNNVNIIHCHQPIDAIYVYLFLLGLRIEIITTFHGFHLLYDLGLKSHLQNRFIYYVNSIISAHQIFVTESLLIRHQQKFKISFACQSIMWNAIDINPIINRYSFDILDKLNISNTALIIGMTGNFSEIKNQLFLCKAVNTIITSGTEVHCLLIGRGPEILEKHYTDCLEFCREQGIEKYIHFLGSRNDVLHIINQLDVYVHISKEETFGLAVVEAMSHGLKCIVSDIPVFKEISEGWKYLIPVQINNTVNLVMELRKFSNIKTRKGYIERDNSQIAYSVSMFGIKNYIRKLEYLYSHL